MAFVVDSKEKLCQLVEVFGRVCRRRNFRVNENKSKVMKCTKMIEPLPRFSACQPARCRIEPCSGR